MATKQKGIIYLRRTGIDYFVSDHAEVLHADFPLTAVADLEIINREELSTVFQNFITTNKLLPASIIIILSDSVLFQKDIVSEVPAEVEEQTKSFVNNVPFQHLGSKTIVVEKTHHVLATNLDLYEFIKNVFEKKGFQITIVAAPISFGKGFVVGDHLGADQARIILQKMDTLKPADNFLNQPMPILSEQPMFVPIQKKKIPKSTLPILLPVFGLLIAILAGTYYITSKQNTTQMIEAEQSVTTAPPSPTEAPTPTPTQAVSTDSAKLENKKYTVQVLNGSGISGQAENTKSQLTSLGFETITTGNSQTRTVKTLVIFKQSVTEISRNMVMSELQKIYEDVSVQEINDAQSDIIITLGNLLP